jgi:hypothetical protein
MLVGSRQATRHRWCCLLLVRCLHRASTICMISGTLVLFDDVQVGLASVAIWHEQVYWTRFSLCLWCTH